MEPAHAGRHLRAHRPAERLDLDALVARLGESGVDAAACESVDGMLERALDWAEEGDVVATMSSTLAPRERSLIGLANPCKNGPIALAPAMGHNAFFAFVVCAPAVAGGMGYTWEFDCQFYYRRSKLLSVAIGSEALWQDRLIDAYEEHAA